MRKLSIVSSIILVAVITMSFMINSTDIAELAIGAKMPKADKGMTDVSGKEVSLGAAKTAKGVLVIFSCNTCPYVRLSESRIKEYTDLCTQKGVGAILLNSNEAQRTEDDSMDEMKKYYADQKLACYYAVDAKSEVADAFGATRTPQCFLFDKDGVLVYKGAIDDNVKDPKAVKNFYLKDAITAVGDGKKPATAESKSIGCTIKRVE
ncbi:MAG: redoxin family protein [Bacteroidota bacterium]|nr:redoxin family protein [Bacteroidota bacterium]